MSMESDAGCSSSPAPSLARALAELAGSGVLLVGVFVVPNGWCGLAVRRG